MSLCEFPASHDSKSSVGSTAIRSSPRRLDQRNGKTTSGNSVGLPAHAPSTIAAVTGRQNRTNANSFHPSSSGQNHQRASSEFAHPGMQYINVKPKPKKTSTNGKTDVPFAPRPTPALKSSAPDPTVPYSSFRNSLSGPVLTRNHGRSALTRSASRKPVPTQPLAATAIEALPPTASHKEFSQKPGTQENGVKSAAASGTRPVSSRTRANRSEPKKRALPVVMEINKMMIPPSFLPAKGDESEEDFYSKLLELWTKSGNPEETYVNWTNPDAPSLWELTTIRSSEAPLIPPGPGSPGSTSSESSVSSATATPQNQLTRKKSRSKGASVVTEVYADSRYIGVAHKRAKLMHQSTRTRNKLGPLDHAQFRDYNLLPIDYFVAPMEGIQAQAEPNKEVEENKEEEGRPRRSRRQPQQARQPTPPPPKEKKKKRRQLTKTSVFIGKSHQIDVSPCPSSAAYKVDPKMYQDSSYVSDNLRDEQIWDPQRAEAAQRRGEDIEGFLRPARELNSQVLLMQALHQADYSVEKAENKFVDLYRASKEPSAEMSDEEKARADAMFETSRKDFVAIAKALNRSVACVLAQYYYWKSMEKRDGKGAYMRLKHTWKNEEDHCAICDDGGILIVCDHCHKAFHPKCLKPPLKEVPKTDWYCSQCLKSPAKLRRLPSLTLGTLPESPKTGEGAKRALPFSAQLQPAQLPQLPSLGQKPANANGKKSSRGEDVIDLTEGDDD